MSALIVVGRVWKHCFRHKRSLRWAGEGIARSPWFQDCECVQIWYGDA